MGTTKSNRPLVHLPSDNAYKRSTWTIGFVLHSDGALPDMSETVPHLK